MKILSVHTALLGDDASSWRIWNIVRLLQARGHNVHLVQYVLKSTYKRLKGNKLDVGDISNSIVTLSISTTVYIKHLRKLSKDNYDLVYGNTHYSAFCSMLGRLRRVPLIFDMHGDVVEEFLLNNQSDWRWKYSSKLFNYFLAKIADFMDLHFSNKIICVSNKMMRYLHEEKKVPWEKMAYVPNGVDLDFFSSSPNKEKARLLRKELDLESKLIFGYVGNFQKWQGVENFVAAAERVDDPRLAFMVVGSDKRSKKRNILFVPKVPRSQIHDYYSICDVLVLPRPSHPATEVASPTKFAEYASAGKPILATNVGDAADFVRRYNCGIVVEDNNPKKLAEGIMQLRSKNEDELRVMGRNSRKLAENEFDWNKVIDNLLKVIEEIA